MIVQGSLNYTTSGRKMGSKSRRMRRAVYHWSLAKETEHTKEINWRDTKEYPSAPLGVPQPEETSVKEYYVSSAHTIAPAYNKGAYQVISSENIKDIGR